MFDQHYLDYNYKLPFFLHVLGFPKPVAANQRYPENVSKDSTGDLRKIVSR